MTKKEYLAELKKSLEMIHINHIEDILSDYEEHYNHALTQGKSEEEISKKLGSPEIIAEAYETDSMISKIKDPEKPFKLTTALKVLGRLILIAPFNFLVMCIPGSLMLALIFAGWVIVATFAAIGIAPLVAGIQTSLVTFSFWMGTAIISTSVALLCFTILSAIIMFYITKQCLLFVIHYLRWNVEFILKK